MNIFESLENLNVSEGCFNDIIDIVEELLSEENLNSTSHITRVYGEPEYDYRMRDENSIGYGTPDVPVNKSAKLIAHKPKEKTVHFHKEGGGPQGDKPRMSGTKQEREDIENTKLYSSMLKG